MSIGGALLAPGLLGTASAATGPTISTLTFTAPGGSLYYPEGIATDNNGKAYVSNTNDNVVATVAGTTVAGSYEGSGSTGDNGPATQAELDNPQSVAVDPAGDVYIADTYNNVIRKVDTTGTITTIAGTGVAGFAGDYGKATSAELTMPSGIALDALGNLYIADSGNNVIRRVDTAGQITTVAGNFVADQNGDGGGAFSGNGGPATAAQLHAPEGVAVDRAGNLYIADTFNNAIREVTPNGIISSLVNTAGTKGSTNATTAAASTLSGPYAVAVDNSTGNVFIADTGNNKIREVQGNAVPGPAAGGPVAPAPAAGLPETPLAVGLPLAALAALGGVLGFRRRRSSRSVSHV